MMRYALCGPPGHPDESRAIFGKFNEIPEFLAVKKDLNTTLADAAKLSINLLAHESGPLDALHRVITETNIDSLEDMDGLIAALSSGGLKLPDKPSESLEEDQLCQVATVLVMLDSMVKHAAMIIRASIRSS